jgi:hypothetical protein
MKNIDLESIRFHNSHSETISNQRPNVPRHKVGEKFLKGPIPLSWLTDAARLPGKALHLAVELWFQAGLTKSPKVKLSMKRLSQFGVTRYSAYRALNSLEAAGLVSVARHRGRLSRVTLLEGTTEKVQADS